MVELFIMLLHDSSLIVNKSTHIMNAVESYEEIPKKIRNTLIGLNCSKMRITLELCY